MKAMGYRLCFFFLLILFTIALVSCSQQQQTRILSSTVIAGSPQSANIISGQVIDDLGAALPGVTVRLRSANGPLLAASTDPNGSFAFHRLATGKYSLRFELEGFTEIEMEGVEVSGDAERRVVVGLHPSLAEELLVVVGESPMPQRAADEVVIVATNDDWVSAPAGQQAREQGKLEARNSKGERISDFPLQHTEVEAEISGYLARTVVQQQYANPFQEVIEAVYVFPLPSMAAVNDFVMETNGHRILGIVRPRKEAEEIYHTAREKGMTASLLTQERSNIFTQSIANIEPGGRVTVSITYLERLVYESGTYEYMFPMVVGPRYISGAPIAPTREFGGGRYAATERVPDADRITPPILAPGERSGHDIGLTVRLNAGLPIRTLDSIAHRIDVVEEGPEQRLVRLSANDTIPNRDFVLRWSVYGDTTQFGILSHREETDGFFTLIIQPPPEPADTEVSPREITFILDVSGSMNGLPIETSKELVKRAMSKLRPQDLFNLFYFSGGNGQLWEQPRPPTAENLSEARQFLGLFQGSGGTEMMAGLRRAISAHHDPRYLQMYVFLTDGYVGEDQAILHLIRKDKGDARFFAFGIGSSVNRNLIAGIGELGGGFAQVVIPQDRSQAEQAAGRFFSAIDSPVLTSPKVVWGDLPVSDVYPRRLNDLFAGQVISLVGKYQGPASGTIAVEGKVGTRPVRYEVHVELPAMENGNEALACFWARQRIHDLGKLALTAGSKKRGKLIGKITDLAVEYRLVSDYTAFVAVDESSNVGNGQPLRVLQPVEMPAGVSRMAAPATAMARIESWGMLLEATSDGKVKVADLDGRGVAARFGIRKGAVLRAVNHVMIHDIDQLEALLLQSVGDRVDLDFNKDGPVTLPYPQESVQANKE